MRLYRFTVVLSACVPLILCTQIPASTSQTQYLITSANITSGFVADRISHTESFSVGVKGNNAGALSVDCTIESDAFRANGGRMVHIPLECTDPAVSMSLSRENVVPRLGWDVTVQL